MTVDEWRRIKTIAGDALEQPPSARAAFIAGVCRGDESLRVAVERLMQSAEDARDLFETPVFAALSLIGASIGPYRIVRELGQGGMGHVYLAERSDGTFDQQVAIKFVGGLPTESVLRRFRDERRILATLNHPNIARLIDGGASADGSPFVIMEYVEGLPIDEFCDTQGLGLEARVQLFLRVCEAVHYAHQRLVVHRDLKATNILVSPDRTVKLLDFGIAKLIDDGEATQATQTMLRMMTPETASPEQVRGESVTIAADVWALGVLLYRLLTGHSPHGPGPLSHTALLRAICDDVPQPPSEARRAGGTASFEPVTRDLDAIVLKALRKEPERRYGSVQQFAEDLERYLSGRPVLAIPDSRRYRAGKFLRRHRVSIAAAALAAVAMLSAAVIAMQQARVAAGERARAEERLAEVRRLANSFLFEFHDAIENLPGALAARQLVVKRAAEHLDGLARDTGDDVTLLRELATANMRLGDILGGGGVANLGDLDGANTRYGRALAIRTTLASRPDPAAADVDGLAQLHVQLSRFTASRSDLETAERHARSAVTMLEGRPATDPPAGTAQLATAYNQLGYVQARRGKTAEALTSLDSARVRALQVVAADPDSAVHQARLVRVLTDHADQLIQANRPREAIASLTDARQRLERLVSREPLNKRYTSDLIYGFNMESAARERLDDRVGAAAVRERAIALATDGVNAEPTDVGMRMALLLTRQAFAAQLLRAGNREPGIAQLRETIGTGQQILAIAPQHGAVQYEVSAARLQLAEALLAGGAKSVEGCQALTEGLAAWGAARARRQLPEEAIAARPRFEALLTKCSAH